MKTVSLYYVYGERGPGKVVENLKRGLAENDCNVLLNPENPEGYAALLQDHPVWKVFSRNDALCGPGLFVTPSGNKEFCSRFDHFVCPSEWVHDMYRKHDELSHATLDVWPVGIDTETWKEKRQVQTGKKNVMLYAKNRRQEEIAGVLNFLDKFDIQVSMISYGSYAEEELMTLCSQSDACVILDGTESQGIAYMQILSCDIPCYVLDVDKWGDGKIECPATSVPYFDETCGMKVKELEGKSFQEFLTNLKDYRPRDFILKNHTLKESARRYLGLLEKHNCKVW